MVRATSLEPEEPPFSISTIPGTTSDSLALGVSADGEHTLAVLGEFTRDEPEVLSDDGKKRVPFSDVVLKDGRPIATGISLLDTPVFKPAGDALLYAAVGAKDREVGLYEDGRLISTKCSLPMSPTYSPDGQHIAFTDLRKDGFAVVVDGAVMEPISEQRTRAVFSPDSRSVAFPAMIDAEFFLFRDSSKVAGPYDVLLPPSFSPDGKSLAYFAIEKIEKEEWFLWKDGEPVHGPYASQVLLWTVSSPTFSPDGGTIAHPAPSGDARVALVVGERRYEDRYVSVGKAVFGFSAALVAFPARRGEKWVVVRNGVSTDDEYDVISELVPSEDGLWFYFAGLQGDRLVRVKAPFITEPLSTSKSSNDDRLDSIRVPFWQDADLEAAKLKDDESAHVYQVETDRRPQYYEGPMPLKYEVVYPTWGLPGHAYQTEIPLFHDFGDFRNWFVYQEATVVGARTKDKRGTLLAEARLRYFAANEGRQGIEAQEVHYGSDGKPSFYCKSEIAGEWKVAERDAIGQKTRDYYFVWPTR